MTMLTENTVLSMPMAAETKWLNLEETNHLAVQHTIFAFINISRDTAESSFYLKHNCLAIIVP